MSTYEEKKIKDFTSQLPCSLEIRSSTSLISNATIEVDYGYGKQNISTYHIINQILPFEAKFYITYNTCDSFLFKTFSVCSQSNQGLTFSMDDIPKSCFSYSASILVNSDFPSNAKLFYKLENEVISPLLIKKGVKFYLIRNFPFSLTFYVKYSLCIDFCIIKSVSVDDYLSLRNITICAADIPNICEIKKREIRKIEDLYYSEY